MGKVNVETAKNFQLFRQLVESFTSATTDIFGDRTIPEIMQHEQMVGRDIQAIHCPMIPGVLIFFCICFCYLNK